jgi:hypothetical protein
MILNILSYFITILFRINFYRYFVYCFFISNYCNILINNLSQHSIIVQLNMIVEQSKDNNWPCSYLDEIKSPQKECIVKKIFGKLSNRYREKIESDFYEKKVKWISSLFGESHEGVYHAIIDYWMGGPVDMYMYPNHIPGMAFVTFDIASYCSKECKPNQLGYFEVAMFTRLKHDDNEKSQFMKQMLRFRVIMTKTARYSTDAVLSPGNTMEIPLDEENKNIACVVIDYYPENNATIIENERLHLLTLIEIHRSEMEYAMANGSEFLFTRLKEAGYYPYSDLDRQPVV